MSTYWFTLMNADTHAPSVANYSSVNVTSRDMSTPYTSGNQASCVDSVEVFLRKRNLSIDIFFRNTQM